MRRDTTQRERRAKRRFKKRLARIMRTRAKRMAFNPPPVVWESWFTHADGTWEYG